VRGSASGTCGGAAHGRESQRPDRAGRRHRASNTRAMDASRSHAPRTPRVVGYPVPGSNRPSGPRCFAPWSNARLTTRPSSSGAANPVTPPTSAWSTTAMPTDGRRVPITSPPTSTSGCPYSKVPAEARLGHGRLAPHNRGPRGIATWNRGAVRGRSRSHSAQAQRRDGDALARRPVPTGTRPGTRHTQGRRAAALRHPTRSTAQGQGRDPAFPLRGQGA